jgi:hypothetical protein
MVFALLSLFVIVRVSSSKEVLSDPLALGITHSMDSKNISIKTDSPDTNQVDETRTYIRPNENSKLITANKTSVVIPATNTLNSSSSLNATSSRNSFTSKKSRHCRKSKKSCADPENQTSFGVLNTWEFLLKNGLVFFTIYSALG